MCKDPLLYYVAGIVSLMVSIVIEHLLSYFLMADFFCGFFVGLAVAFLCNGLVLTVRRRRESRAN